MVFNKNCVYMYEFFCCIPFNPINVCCRITPVKHYNEHNPTESSDGVNHLASHAAFPYSLQVSRNTRMHRQ